MIYKLAISLDDIIIEQIVSIYICVIVFTLTVNAVNDAPILLQPFENLAIIEDSWAAMVVLRSM